MNKSGKNQHLQGFSEELIKEARFKRAIYYIKARNVKLQIKQLEDKKLPIDAEIQQLKKELKKWNTRKRIPLWRIIKYGK